MNIYKQPSCTCTDYESYGKTVLCKHISLIFLCALHAEESKLETVEFQKEKVQRLLLQEDIDQST